MLAAILLLIIARLILPYAIRGYVNHVLNNIQDYHGHVGRIRVDLYRGAYTIVNLQLQKTNNSIAQPFISMAEMDLSVEWKELFHGNLVGKITVNQPKVNFVQGPTPQKQQTGLNKSWKKTLQNLFPFTINKFQVNAGEIRYIDAQANPKVNIYVTNLYATATNLTNVKDEANLLPAGLTARGVTIGGGKLNLELRMNPMADSPTFKLATSITNMDLTALNDFFRAYGAVDVSRGKFAVYLDIAAANERYQGYIKPFFFNMQVFNWRQDKKENPLKMAWEFVVQGITELVRNHRYNQLATRVDLSGTLKKSTSMDLWGTIGRILQNAFLQAMVPRVAPRIALPATPTGVPPVQNSS